MTGETIEIPGYVWRTVFDQSLQVERAMEDAIQCMEQAGKLYEKARADMIEAMDRIKDLRVETERIGKLRAMEGDDHRVFVCRWGP